VSKCLSMFIRSVVVGAVVAMAPLVPPSTPANASAEPAPAPAVGSAAPSVVGTALGAITWFRAHNGDTSYENACEKAVENAWGTTGVWPNASAHWEGAIAAGKAHVRDMAPPFGAFVYWRTSSEGHVGIADGQGGFYSTNVNGAIGHSSNLFYHANYLGWSDPQVPVS
jgi:hypothetical protein